MSLAFLVVAIILFVLQALGVGEPRFHLGWIGLAFFAGSFIV